MDRVTKLENPRVRDVEVTRVRTKSEEIQVSLLTLHK